MIFKCENYKFINCFPRCIFLYCFRSKCGYSASKILRSSFQKSRFFVPKICLFLYDIPSCPFVWAILGAKCFGPNIDYSWQFQKSTIFGPFHSQNELKETNFGIVPKNCARKMLCWKWPLQDIPYHTWIPIWRT